MNNLEAAKKQCLSGTCQGSTICRVNHQKSNNCFWQYVVSKSDEEGFMEEHPVPQIRKLLTCSTEEITKAHEQLKLLLEGKDAQSFEDEKGNSIDEFISISELPDVDDSNFWDDTDTLVADFVNSQDISDNE